MPTQELRAIWHPARARILEILMQGPATRSQLTKTAGGSLAKVAYHSKVLCRAGCIQLVTSSNSHPDDPFYEIT